MRFFLALMMFLVFLLINLGGYVHNTGSSLACPDWPLCHGQFFPEMVSGVLIEHSHRLLASLVGVMTLIFAYLSRKNTSLYRLALVSVAVVILQGILGGITVIYKLPSFISTAHLGVSQIFLCLLIYSHHSLDKGVRVHSHIGRSLLLVLCLVYLQIILGAWIRHQGLGSICGVGYQNSILCQSKYFVNSGSELLHMMHRWFAILVSFAIVIFATKLSLSHRREVVYWARFLIGILFVQLLLGILTIGTGFRPLITMLHLGGATLLLTVSWKLYLIIDFPCQMNRPASDQLAKSLCPN